MTKAERLYVKRIEYWSKGFLVAIENSIPAKGHVLRRTVTASLMFYESLLKNIPKPTSGKEE